MKFHKCPICGNIITIVEGDVQRVRCCGKELEELIPNTIDAAFEKHVPVYTIEDNKIKVVVGDVEHPMIDEHYIMFIAQVYKDNINIVKLHPVERPVATFDYISDSKIYAYCNLHGLWLTEVK